MHDSNDSRAQYSDNIVQADEMEKMHRAFPLLRELIADWPIADAETRVEQAA